MAVDRHRHGGSATARAAGAADPQGWQVSFGEFDLDTTVFELRREGRPVHLEPQAFDVLTYLVRHRDRVVSKEELLDQVWGDRFVTESSLTSRVKHVRRALGDDGRGQRCIRTVHGRGYRFAPEATVTTGGPAAGDPAPDGAADRHRLPAERTPLFGRREAVASVAAAVRAHRLVSLCGIGGSGKSRLATAVGHRCRDGFPDGVRWVGLGSCDSAAAVEAAILDAAGAAPGAARPTPWTLGSRRVLVVLDDAEQVRDELAAVLDGLLDRTGAPRFLVTSRVPLELTDERRIRVGPLPWGGPDTAAEQVLRAAAERFGRAPADGDQHAVRRICDVLGGLPLAIELAAAALRVLTPEELAARLEHGRLDLLRAGRTGRERQGSLLGVLEDAWARLDPVERELLVRLSPVEGEFGVADAERVARQLPAGAVAAAMAHMVDLGVVTADAGRFRLLETVRRFVRPPQPAAALTPPVDGRARPDARTARARPTRPRRAGWTCAAG